MGTHKSQAECQNCHHSMVPRVVFSEGRPSHSICPFCGLLYKDFNPYDGAAAFAFGTFIGRVWKMAPVEKGFVDALTHSGLTVVSAKRIFAVLKLITLIAVLALIRMR